VRKFASPLLILGLAGVTLVGAAGVAASSRAGYVSPHVFTDAGLTLKLTSSTPGVTFSGDTLVCPPMLIMTSSGKNLVACEFTISSTGQAAPSFLEVTMTVSGITPAQVFARKFAINPQPGPLVYFGTTSQTVYAFTGAQLPATVNPGLVWGANAGAVLDNSDLGATLVVTYTVVAVSVQGETASPVASGSEIVEGQTFQPRASATPPPTGSASDSSIVGSTPLFALLICFFLGWISLIVVAVRRRSVHR
jgi:hypothetical protein